MGKRRHHDPCERKAKLGPAFNLKRIVCPARRNNVAYQLRPDVDPIAGKPRPGFETKKTMRAESRTREIAAKRTYDSLAAQADV